jgi:hypothetical protein
MDFISIEQNMKGVLVRISNVVLDTDDDLDDVTYSIGQSYPMQEIDESRVVAQRIEPWVNVEIRHPT